MANRSKIKPDTQVQLFKLSRRRCCFCFYLRNDITEKKGQIAHVDRNRNNNSIQNLAWLCLEHHDEYDTQTSQSKGLTKEELIEYRTLLHEQVEKTFERQDVPNDMVSVIEKINFLQLQVAQLQSPLSSISELYGITPDELRDLLSEYASKLDNTDAEKLIKLKALLAAEQYEDAIQTADKFSEKLRHEQEKSISNIAKLTALEAESLIVSGTAFLKLASYPVAVEMLRKANSLVNERSDRSLWVLVQKALAVALFANGHLSEALPLYMQTMTKDGNGAFSEANFEDYCNLGQFCLAARELEQAEALFSKAFNFAKDHFARNDNRLAITLMSLSQVSIERKDYERAEDIGRKYLGLLQENKLIESLYAGAGFYNLAKILRVAGKRKEALEFYERAILIYSRILGDESLHVAMSYNDMGLCYLEELRFSEATSNFDKAIKLSELKCFDSLSRSSFIANRGRALLQVGRVREAQADFKQALNMRKDYLGAEHPMVADMNSLLKLTESVPQQ